MNLPLTVYKSRKKALIITAVGSLMGASGTVFMYRVDDLVLGWGFIVVAVMLLILGIGSLADRKPQLIITERGITEMFTIREEIEWEAILYVYDFFYRSHTFTLLLLPRSYKPELLRPTWFWRLDGMYAREGVKAMYIRVSGLDIGPKELVRIIEAMVRAHHPEAVE